MGWFLLILRLCLVCVPPVTNTIWLSFFLFLCSATWPLIELCAFSLAFSLQWSCSAVVWFVNAHLEQRRSPVFGFSCRQVRTTMSTRRSLCATVKVQFSIFSVETALTSPVWMHLLNEWMSLLPPLPSSSQPPPPPLLVSGHNLFINYKYDLSALMLMLLLLHLSFASVTAVHMSLSWELLMLMLFYCQQRRHWMLEAKKREEKRQNTRQTRLRKRTLW